MLAQILKFDRREGGAQPHRLRSSQRIQYRENSTQDIPAKVWNLARSARLSPYLRIPKEFGKFLPERFHRFDDTYEDIYGDEDEDGVKDHISNTIPLPGDR